VPSLFLHEDHTSISNENRAGTTSDAVRSIAEIGERIGKHIRFAAKLRVSPLAIHNKAANDQHEINGTTDCDKPHDILHTLSVLISATHSKTRIDSPFGAAFACVRDRL
jgi:hypothetical protein